MKIKKIIFRFFKVYELTSIFLIMNWEINERYKKNFVESDKWKWTRISNPYKIILISSVTIT